MANRKTHLSRLSMPRNWPVEKKGTKWILKPNPGPHNLKYSMPLHLILKMLKYSKTSKESKNILNKGLINVNGKIRKDIKFPIGMMDVVSVPSVNEHFRIVVRKGNKLDIMPIKKEEANVKPFKIKGKTLLRKGIMQVNLYDGTNILVEKDGYKVNDTLVVDFSGEKMKVNKHLKMEKGANVLIFEGKFAGTTGVVEDVKKTYGKSSIIVNTGKEKIETLLDYAFVIDKSISHEVKK